jgi:hypothetical protein
MCATVNGETVVTELVQGFSNADFGRVHSYLHDDLRAYITNRDGGVDEVRGADGYLGRVQAMDLPSASFRLDITQAVTVRARLDHGHGRGSRRPWRQNPAQPRHPPLLSTRWSGVGVVDGGGASGRERGLLVTAGVTGSLTPRARRAL